MKKHSEKIGIFGGSFNPPHLGHINSLQTILKKTGLSKIYVLPASQNPTKPEIESPTKEQRFEMLKLALASYGEQFIADDRELKRAGPSFTIETIKDFRKQFDSEDLFLIVGADQFEEFDKWKDPEKILTEVNLIVTSRPGYDFPHSIDDLPKSIKKLAAEFDFNLIELTTGRSIQCVSISDVPISSTELRKRLRKGSPPEKYLPLAVENYIRENNLYKVQAKNISNYKDFSKFCGQVLSDKKGIDVRCFDISKISSVTDFVIVASGTSTRHTASLAENTVRAVKDQYLINPQSVEGLQEGRWVVVDYGSLIIHIFYDFVRSEYRLEDLWKSAPHIELLK